MYNKICIVGAGAIGSLIGARLAQTGQVQVSAYARGKTLESLRIHGWRVLEQGSILQAPVAAASHSAEELGIQDVVIIAVKGQALADISRQIKPLIGSQTILLPAMNGVPWWFCQGISGLADTTLSSVDPKGEIAQAFPASSVVGCVVHASAARVEPGLIRHQMGEKLIIGEPTGKMTSRVNSLQKLLQESGFDVSVSNNIRSDIWYKLWGNLTINPISAVTGATADAIVNDSLLRKFCSSVMLEAAAIGERIGCPIKQSPDDRQAITAQLGAFKSSMLQDAEAGRALEIDAIVASVQELGVKLGYPTPYLDGLLGIVRLFARVHGLYPL